jgi:phenylacetic acid degradation operon negative regulatory protein
VQPSARSLVLDLLSTLRRGTMPVVALVEAGALFGITENNVRVALTRLTSAGTVGRDRRGRYRLSPGSSPIARRASSWRNLERGLRRWNGGWVGFLETAGGSGRRAERERRARGLQLLGFAALAPGLCVRPDNLSGGVDALRRETRELGLRPGDPIVGLRDLDPELDARARQLWDGASRRGAHRDALARIEKSARVLGALPAERAMVESFLIGGGVLRQLILDPKLPDEIVAGDERRALLEAMRDYDRLGRRAWAGFLARFSVPHLRAPLDTRLIAGGAT